jgi:hypothetical protein
LGVFLAVGDNQRVPAKIEIAGLVTDLVGLYEAIPGGDTE